MPLKLKYLPEGTFAVTIILQFENTPTIKPQDKVVRPHWVVAKIYMPKGNEGNTGPEVMDFAAALHLLRNCIFFTSLDRNVLKQVCKHENAISVKICT